MVALPLYQVLLLTGEQRGMYALIGVGAMMGIWVSVMRYFEIKTAAKHLDVIDAAEAEGSVDGITHESVLHNKGLDSKV